MTAADEPAGRIARAVLAATLYMSLGTADAGGRPRVTPVFFAEAGEDQLVWLSDPRSRHSRTLAARPQVAISVFDSRLPLEQEGYGVHLEGIADRPEGAARDRGLAALTRRSEAHGGRTWTPATVEPPAPLRLYRVTVQAITVWPEPGARDR